MTTSVQTVDFTSFVFAQGEELKTTSLKIAEAFGKQHKHVIRDIEKIVSQTLDIINTPRFGLIETDVKVGFGTRKDKAYEMNKDGFMLVVMGYTGEAAMKIKVAYINAFNLMHAKLFPKVAQLESPTITKAQYGELNARVCEIASDGKTRMALWSRFNNHFRISSYKNLPSEKYDDALLYLEQKKAMQEPEMKQTSLQGYASMILGLPNDDSRVVVQNHNGVTVVMNLAENDFVGTFETIVHELKMRGFHVVKDSPENKLETIGKIVTATFEA